jgi:N-acetylglutamate synthase-like GNAT family acetyltransferase
MIRQFRSDDATPCNKLIQDCLKSDPFLPPSLSNNLQDSESARMMSERAQLFYVAVFDQESEILGVAGLDLNEIRLMYVSPQRRRAGIGKALFHHLAEMTPASFFSEIFVYSSPAAVGFYKSLGFTEKGPAAFEIGGELMPTVFMVYPTKRTLFIS